MAQVSVSERVFQALRDRILGLEFLPGYHLVETPLAKEFGVSCTPVREALHRLVEAGLAKREPARGIRVYQPNAEDVKNVSEMRAVLEPVAFRSSVPLFEAADWKELEGIIAETEAGIRDRDVVGLGRLNERFHRRLASRSPNQIMIDVLNGLVDRERLNSIHFCTVYRLWENDLNDHRAIFDLARSGDIDAAAERLGRHIQEFPRL